MKELKMSNNNSDLFNVMYKMWQEIYSNVYWSVLVTVDHLSLSDVYMKSIVLGIVEAKFKQTVKCCVMLHMFVDICWGLITIHWAMNITNVIGWNWKHWIIDDKISFS